MINKWKLIKISESEFDSLIKEAIFERVPSLRTFKLKLTHRFSDDLNIDSVDLIAIWTKIEHKLLIYNINLSKYLEDNSLLDVKTLSDLREFVYTRALLN
jgi:acyl carrier protein